jgi:sugar phosphate isomerase/epimerase
MMLALHGICALHTNILADIRIAKEAEYDALGIWGPKLERYLDVGHRTEELLPALGSLRAAEIGTIGDIERQDPEARRALRERCERLAAAAQVLNSPAILVMAHGALEGDAWPDMRRKIGRSLGELSDIAAPFGVNLALEPASFAPLHTLAQALEVIDVANRGNVGLVVDTFHLWTGGTPWDEVAVLDPSLIVVAHIGDALPRGGEVWNDEDRDVLPGDGIVPVEEGIAAIRATGYDGLWSVELLGGHHWEWDPAVLAHELKRRAETLLQD